MSQTARARTPSSVGVHATTRTGRGHLSTAAALLVIDMQLVAFDGKITPPVADGTRLLESVARLINGCRWNATPVVYLQTSAPAGQPYAMDVHGWGIHPLISPNEEDHVVTKRNSSGFDGTDLTLLLQTLRIHTVLICGIWSEHCVANTSTDALRLG